MTLRCECDLIIDRLQCAALAFGMDSATCLTSCRVRDPSRLKEQRKSIVAKSAEIQ